MLIATDAIIAVGSGTINDLCKYAAFKLNKPYVVFATALSMNGYASTTSSITIGNLKQSLPTTLPRAIFINLTVVRNAPLRLTASGVGDLLCRSTAEADWHLSHLLTGSTYHPTVYQWLKPYEEKLYSSTSILQEIEHLSQMQILSGLGMCASQGSYPASQGEHIIAHIMDSLHPNDTLHGEQIAVTTITMAKLQEAMLQSKPVLPPSPIGQIINSNWDEICHKIRQNMIAAERLEAIARTCGLATHYHQLQWNKDDYALAIRQGAYKRNRFGFLDLAILSGRLDSLIESII
jgi:glycerol-1-phosphate dehydrogenase [NAD(P)+]